MLILVAETLSMCSREVVCAAGKIGTNGRDEMECLRSCESAVAIETAASIPFIEIHLTVNQGAAPAAQSFCQKLPIQIFFELALPIGLQLRPYRCIADNALASIEID